MSSRQEDREERVELGKRVDARVQALDSVVALRVSTDMLSRVSQYGELRNMTVSEVFRAGAERLLSNTIELGPVYVTGITLEGPRIVSGLPSLASGRSITATSAKEGSTASA